MSDRGFQVLEESVWVCVCVVCGAEVMSVQIWEQLIYKGFTSQRNYTIGVNYYLSALLASGGGGEGVLGMEGVWVFVLAGGRLVGYRKYECKHTK